MAIIKEENILKILNAYNPWWVTNEVNPKLIKEYKRLTYFEAYNRLNEKQIRRSILLTGTRRVGKTTIQYQMIDKLLKDGVNPKKILFISFDHPSIKLSEFETVLNCYKTNVCIDEDIYYFFDEIQYLDNWDLWMKTLYDSNPDLKIVATGSVSPILMKGASESGTGRWSTINVPTLSFYEYIELMGIEKPVLDSNLKPTSFLSMSQIERSDVMSKLKNFEFHFNRYLEIGGFPELVLSENDILAKQVLREDVVDKVLKRDLPSLYNIRNSIELERLFLYLCHTSSDIISIETIAKELTNVTRQTIENYIKYLESASLIYRSMPIDMSGKQVLKAKAKIYISDAAVKNAVLMDDDILTNETELGKIVETVIYKHVKSFYYQNSTRVGYIRSSKDKEVDVVVEYPNSRNMLIEVKYRYQAPIKDDSAIVELCDKASASIIVTKKYEDFGIHNTKKGVDILRLPAFAFLYLLGHAEFNRYKGKD